MFCANCGAEIDDNAVFCVHCGVPANAQATPKHVAAEQQTGAVYRPIVGFILSFFFSLVGAIISIVEYKKAKETGGDHRFALAGIIIGFVSTGLIVIFSIIYAVAVVSLIDAYYAFGMFI